MTAWKHHHRPARIPYASHRKHDKALFSAAPQKESQPQERLADLHLHGQKKAQDKPFSFAHLFGFLAWGAYEKQKSWVTKKDVTMEQIIASHLPNWQLVAQTQQDTLEAVDNIWLVQNTQSLDCVVAFEGTHTFAEFFGNLKSPKYGYCGIPDIHQGYADKLFWLMKYSMPRLRPKLAKCNKAPAPA